MSSEREEIREAPHAVQVICPICKETQIIYVPDEPVPQCPDCRVDMIVKEVLDEGKSY